MLTTKSVLENGARFSLAAGGNGMPARERNPIAESYGSLTFNKRVMAQYLSKSVFEKLINTIENGEKLDVEIADEVAQAMKEWAVAQGATHFCHWFQPQRWSTAEKHDGFLAFDKQGQPIFQFSGKQLIQGEPDASSFPSGGSRSTFEARGYTAWDPTSPAFLVKTGKSTTLAIPCVYLSWTGEVLDMKTPLSRALAAVEDRAYRMVKLFGNRSARYCRMTIGAEQEYFLVSKDLYNKRPDLVYAARTLFGAAAAKHQQMEDHYFGSIKPRVLDFMADVDSALMARGIPAKTRHNEVAPNQFELAPIYEEANLAVDHNLQAMEIMRQVAEEHGLMILLHEKPFAGINGSGKHLNWSLSDSEGNNLLDPGNTPKKSVQFLTFLAAVLTGVNKFGGLIRASVADAGNDHRLGANEAPPAIMSVYLGTYLDKILNDIEKGAFGKEAAKAALDLGLKHLPNVALDNSDRNRTSPIAFTGNKFEFRAVGASQNTSEPATVTALVMAYGLDVLLRKLEGGSESEDITERALKVIKDSVKETKRVRFEGNGYSEEWHKEAAKRGLPVAKDTPAAVKVFIDKDVEALFEQYKVLKKSELHAKYEIKLETYIKTKEIELKLLRELAATSIQPAVTKQINQLGQAASYAGTGSRALKQKIRQLGGLFDEIQNGIEAVEEVLEKSAQAKDLTKRAEFISSKGVSSLAELREACDKAQDAVDEALWPFPKYRDMLFPL